ncbi:MAG: alpha-2-macroglobulin family protein [Pseudanabaenaceae cyanobacterium]
MTKRAIAFGLMVLLSALLVVACQERERFGAIEPLPPPVLPSWIERVSPTGVAQSGDRLQILFREPLVAVSDLDSPQTQRILAKFAITPAVPGRFRLLTPRLVTFQGEKAFPKSARLQVTLKAGLADLAQNRLAEDLQWTFETAAIALTDLPKADEPVALNPEIGFTSNTRLDLRSLQKVVKVRPEGGAPLTIRIIEKDLPSRDRQQQFEELPWRYALLPGQLQPGTRYQVEFGEGLQPYQGNIALAKPVTAAFRTYGALTFARLELTNVPDGYGAYGRFVNGSGMLRFSNPLQESSVAENLRIAPAPAAGVPWFRAYDGGDTIELNPYALQPNTRYEIELLPNLMDTFGQKLGQKQTVVYETGDLAADLWAPDGLHIFPVGQGDLKLHVSTTNLPDRRFQLQHQALRPEDLVFIDAQFPEDGLRLPARGDFLPVTSAAHNQVRDTEIPVQRYLGQDTGVLAYRVSARTYRYRDESDNPEKWREPSFTGLIHLTNIGVFAQWFPTGGWVLARTLREGQPIPNAEVVVYPLQLGQERQTPTVCAQGRTDGAGRVSFDRDDLQACGGGNEAPELLVVVRAGTDWSFVQVRGWSGAYGYGVNAGWEGSTPLTRGIVFSDRRLYRPGETAWLSGFAYFLENGEVRSQPNTDYTVTLVGPNGQNRELGVHTTDRFGSFALSVPLPAEAVLGEYQVVAKDERGGEVRGGFRVAEFQAPNFQTTLTVGTEGDTVVAGQTLTAQAKASYLFGAPVRSGKVTYTVTQERGRFQPPGWDGFAFGPEWFWPREAPEVPYQVLTAEGTLDATGQAQQTLNLPPEIPYPLTYAVVAEIIDASNRSVAARRILTVLPGDRLIGLKAGFVGEAGQPIPIEVVVINGAGKPERQRVQLALQRMTFRQVAQAIEGGMVSQPQVEYETVATTELFSGEGARPVTLTAPSAGSYRIRANFAGATTEATATDWQIWISGSQAFDWGHRYRNNRLELKLDKTTYRPGERARVVVPSPYPEAELWVAVVRDRLLYQKAEIVKGAAPQVEIPITEAMGPNAAVQAVLVRRGAPLAATDLNAVKSLTMVGLTPFSVELTARYLDVTATPQATKLAPGSRQTLTLQLRDKTGQPVAGKLAIAVVDEAILQLTDYRFPDLVKTVFAEREISQRFRDNRQDVVLQPLASALEKGWGFGGGKSLEDPELRTQGEPLAYFNGHVVTNAQGQAEVSFTLPDNLTTWRVLAVATDGKLRFGRDDRATFVATKPLLVNPLVPAFVRPGDRPQLGVAVTGEAQTLQLSQEITSGDTALARRTEDWAFGGSTQSQRRELAVPAPVANDLQVRYQVQGARDRDGFQVTVPVRQAPVWEQTVTTGVGRSTVEIPLEVSGDRALSTELTVILGTSALADGEWAAESVLAADQDDPFLETQIARLRILGAWQRLGRTVPQGQVNDVLAKLRALQRPDGGLAAYPQGKSSDPWLTPLAWEALQPWTGGPNRNTLRNYLEALVANPGRVATWTPLAQQQIRLGALLALGARSDFAADLWEKREQLGLLGQVQLARHLSRLPDWQAEAATLRQNLRQRLTPGSRSDLPTVPPGWQWLGDRTALQAEYLRLALIRNESAEELARLVQGLLDLRQNGTWGSTYANGAAWLALGAYQTAQPPRSAKVTIQVAGQTFTANLQGDRPFQQKITALPTGRPVLRLQTQGNAPLHYTVVYRYIPKEAPGRLEGLRIARIVTPVGQAKPWQQHFLAPVRPLTLKTGDVVDVGLEIAGDRPLTHLQIEDFLPAGLEAVDRSFAIANPAVAAQPSAWEIQHQEIRGDRVRGYAERLEPGAYEFHYLARAVTPGTYTWPGAIVTARHAPETFGRTVAAQLQLREP